MQTTTDNKMSQEKQDLLSFLMMDEIPLTVDEDMEQLEIDMTNYVSSLTDEEADVELTKLTL